MRRGALSAHFVGIGFKRLTGTEVDPNISNGHEIAAGKFTEMLGRDDKEFPDTQVIHLADIHEDGALIQHGMMTFYDSRRNQPRRPEYRLYYKADITLIQEYAEPGDLLVVGLKPDGRLVVLIAAAGSTYESQLIWLFGIEELAVRDNFTVTLIEDQIDRPLDMAARLILENLGIDAAEEADRYLPELISAFNGRFPATRVFSEFARSTLGKVDATDADGTLMSWMDREEELFRTLERHIVKERIDQGFASVEEFVSFSLSVQNRRKSRVGFALENHLEQIFILNGIAHSRGEKTENNQKPDFIFPGISQYQDPNFSSARLSMLGVKSTCKDRWRQVLAEAERIQRKHLLTMEPAISRNQTDQMAAHNLQLVLPKALHVTYQPGQHLINLAEFIGLVKERQA